MKYIEAEQLKAEIERLKEIGGIVPLDNREQNTGYESALMDVEIFLDSLESEKPINQDLEKELARFYLKDLCGSGKDEIPEATLHHNFPIMWDDLNDIARHFAEWGAIHINTRKEE